MQGAQLAVHSGIGITEMNSCGYDFTVGKHTCFSLIRTMVTNSWWRHVATQLPSKKVALRLGF
jgi:hypothetical protein